MPFIEYSLNKDYIAKVLCINKEKPKMHCDGKCYLMKRVQETSESESPLVPNAPSNQQVKETTHHWCGSLDDFNGIATALYTRPLHAPFQGKPNQLNQQPPTPPPQFQYSNKVV